MKVFFGIFLLSICQLPIALGQKMKLCDSLNGRDYVQLYQEASFVCTGRIIRIEKGIVDGKDYYVRPTYSYKGILQEFPFYQLGNPKFFHFKLDSNYVFFVFQDYQDNVFRPCLFFGLSKKMVAFLEWAAILCKIEPVEEDGNCAGNLDEICGCNGVTYGNPCEARRAGVNNAVRGRCPRK